MSGRNRFIRILAFCLVTGLPVYAPCQSKPKEILQSAKLTASDGMPGDYFGASVALSGNTLVIGAPYASLTGGVYVFIYSEDTWNQVAKLTPSDGETGAQFGFSVAISGETIAVGAPMQAGGAVYVFVEPSGGWTNMTQTAKLTNQGNVFGYSVAINGGSNAIVVGALFDDAVYAFQEPNSGWSNMTAPTATLATPAGSYLTGAAVAIDGNTVVAAGSTGESGAAFVFLLQGGSGNINSIATLLTVPGNPGFYAAAIDGDTVVAGAQTYGNGQPGAVFLFVKPSGGWTDMTQTAELTQPFARQPAFGSAVAVSGRAVLGGAPSTPSSGIALAYLEPPSGWTNSSSPNYWMKPSDNSDSFGENLAFAGTVLAAGASGVDNAQGAVYIFGQP